MGDELSGIATLIFAEDIGSGVGGGNITSAFAINAASLDVTDAYEAIRDGCIRGISATVEAAVGTDYTLTFTVWVAGSATSVETTIAGTSDKTGYAEFPTTTALVNAGDTIQCYIKESASGGTAPDNVLVHVLYQMGRSQI